MAVKVSRDLSVAWVDYAILGREDADADIEFALASANGFLRKGLAAELTVRRVPELRFRFDETGARGRAMDRLIDSVADSNTPSEPEAPEDDV